MTTPHSLINAMVDTLLETGDLRDLHWAAAMRRVPRHAFIPDQVTANGHTIDRDLDAEGWMRACYLDQALVTQTDDGDADGPGIATSSASAPSVVAMMLDALDVRDDETILEIGTGTGWNAALLCARLGSGNVTTVEVDRDVAVQARRNLHRQGWTPTVAWADGEQGFPLNAPYHRVIATCAAQHVPYAWIRQTAPGGRVVLPWTPGPGAGALLTLDVHDGTASGRCGDELAFMELRGQRDPLTPPPDLDATPEFTDTTGIPAWSIMWGGAAFALRILLPSARWGMRTDHAWIGRDTDRSWVRVSLDGGDGVPSSVEGAGPLWDQVQAADAWWREHDRPGPDRFGLTVTEDGQVAWLDDPGNVIRA